MFTIIEYYIGIWEDNKPPSRESIRKHTNGGLAALVICLGVCEDS